MSFQVLQNFEKHERMIHRQDSPDLINLHKVKNLFGQTERPSNQPPATGIGAVILFASVTLNIQTPYPQKDNSR